MKVETAFSCLEIGVERTRMLLKYSHTSFRDIRFQKTAWPFLWHQSFNSSWHMKISGWVDVGGLTKNVQTAAAAPAYLIYISQCHKCAWILFLLPSRWIKETCNERNNFSFPAMLTFLLLALVTFSTLYYAQGKSDWAHTTLFLGTAK